MRLVQVLEAADQVAPSDWCRPLQIVAMHGGHSDHYSFKSSYTGCPENNAKWVRVRDVLGACWHDKPAGVVCDALGPYEFVRGEVPEAHQLDMRDYNSLASMRAKKD